MIKSVPKVGMKVVMKVVIKVIKVFSEIGLPFNLILIISVISLSTRISGR